MPNIKFNDERVLAAFVDNMITDKNIAGLTKQQRGWLRHALQQQLGEYMEQMVIFALPNDKLEQLSAMMDREPSDAEVDALFKDAGVDFNGVVMRAMKRFREAYMARTDDMEMIEQAREGYIEALATMPSVYEEAKAQGMFAMTPTQFISNMTKSQNKNEEVPANNAVLAGEVR